MNEKSKTPETDTRPWRTITLKLPENVATQFERARYFAKTFGMANSPVEEIEALSVELMNSLSHDYMEALENARRGLNDYKVNSLLVLEETGFRCLLCKTSTNLTIHHMYPRGGHGEDRPEDINACANLAPLCLNCHEKVQPKWREYVDDLRERKALATEEVTRYGYRL